MSDVTSNQFLGDEYTNVLSEYRPVGEDSDARTWVTYRTVERLVSDARRYRTRAIIAEEEANQLRSELIEVLEAVARLVGGL